MRGPGAPARLLLLLLLLLPASLLFAHPERPLPSGSAQPLLHKFPRGGGGEDLSPSAMELSTSHYQANRAAAVAFHYVTYKRGSPNRLFQVGLVKQARLEDVPGTGHKYHLKFEMRESIENGSSLICTAEILYHRGKTPVPPEIHFTIEGESEAHWKEADNLFYNRIQNLPEPLETKFIPGNDGNMPDEMRPIFNIAKAASGYIIWQNSTQKTWYNMIQIQSVKQVKRNDDYLEFSYEVLLHDITSQDIIPWHMQVLWHPQHGVKVEENSRQSDIN